MTTKWPCDNCAGWRATSSKQRRIRMANLAQAGSAFVCPKCRNTNWATTFSAIDFDAEERAAARRAHVLRALFAAAALAIILLAWNAIS